MDQLEQFGWNEELNHKWTNHPNGTKPARVVADFGTSLKVATPDIRTAELSGKLAHYSDKESIPKVGDWVAVQLPDNGSAVIEEVIPRHSEIARKVAGHKTVKQVIAANIDIAFVLLALDHDFSIERLKRFLYQLSINSVQPVIVLNKADKTDNVGFYIDQLEMFELQIIVTNALTGSGVNEIINLIQPGRTAILLGSSGVGKSTLANQLLGREEQRTEAVRTSDSTGKHTTVHRELFVLPNGGLLIDTPGIRELQLWGTEDELDENFDDIAAIISQCKFTTCQHGSERGCAIRKALQNGTLMKSHYASYTKMKAELLTLKGKNTVRQRQNNKKSLKSLRRQAKDSINDLREDTN